MIPREILKKIRQIEIRTKCKVTEMCAGGKLFLCFALVLSGGSIGCSTQTKTHVKSDATEWFPTLDFAAKLDDSSRQEVLNLCGVKDSRQIWIRTLDLNQDNKEDCIVTVALPNDAGPYWTNFRSVTYVYRGANEGAFGRRWSDATLWFSLVTYEGQDHVRYGDCETVRQFSLFRRKGEWLVRISEHEYGNAGGEASVRLMKPRHSANWILPPAQIIAAKPEYP